LELLDYFRRQFEYDTWANREVLFTIQRISASASETQLTRSLELLSHILSAERLWLERLAAQRQSLPVWPEFLVNQCEAQIEELSRLWRDYFSQLTSSALSEKMAYKNSKGESWSSTVQDVLTHVLLHSAYHRGQIASQMRTAGHTPAYTDFIHSVRTGLIE
jgi:uncharacterized damage-inducible protein DinB